MSNAGDEDAGSGKAATKTWAPLRKRLAVMRTVRLFSKDTGKDQHHQHHQHQQQHHRDGDGDDDGGVYCGGGDGEGGGCDREDGHCQSDAAAAGAKGSPVLGAAGATTSAASASGRRSRGGVGGSGSGFERLFRGSHRGSEDFDAHEDGGSHGGEVPAHALFLQHRGPKFSDCGIHEGADDDEARRAATGDERRSSGDLQKMKTKKKSIGDKFSFILSRRSGDVSAGERSASSSSVRTIRPSADQVQRWGVSFDSLLNDKYGLALFRAFLKTEYSDENIEFWIACEEYRSLVGLKKQTMKAQKIYSEFVAFQAPREVNLDSTTRLATINSMGSPDGHLFEQAQKRIQALMEKDSYQRFLRSDVYQGLAKEVCHTASSSTSSTSATAASTTASISGAAATSSSLATSEAHSSTSENP